MLSAAWVCGLWLAVSPPAGVVRLVRGPVQVDGHAASSGSLLRVDGRVDTSADGWVELFLPGLGRLRLSPSTRLDLEGGAPHLLAGRLWLHAADARAARSIRLGGHSLSLGPGSLLVLAVGPAGQELAVERGWAEAAGVRVGPGELHRLGGGRPQVGGQGLFDLTALEADSARGDLLGVRRFLLERVRAARLAAGRPGDADQIGRQLPEAAGHDGGALGYALETSLRPPPFFEEEVPPKGPNVRVEVSFQPE